MTLKDFKKLPDEKKVELIGSVCSFFDDNRLFESISTLERVKYSGDDNFKCAGGSFYKYIEPIQKPEFNKTFQQVMDEYHKKKEAAQDNKQLIIYGMYFKDTGKIGAVGVFASFDDYMHNLGAHAMDYRVQGWQPICLGDLMDVCQAAVDIRKSVNMKPFEPQEWPGTFKDIPVEGVHCLDKDGNDIVLGKD